MLLVITEVFEKVQEWFWINIQSGQYLSGEVIRSPLIGPIKHPIGNLVSKPTMAHFVGKQPNPGVVPILCCNVRQKRWVIAK